jgi:hypothetical protein
VTFEDLSSLRWKCGTCEEWHYGPCLDFSYHSPLYWTSENDEGNAIGFFDSGKEGLPHTFLNEDICVMEGEHYFVRGLIHPKRVELPPLFSWLSNRIDYYPYTLNLKMHAYIQELGIRPNFELEATGHPLSQEFHHGITPARVREIMERWVDLPVM